MTYETNTECDIHVNEPQKKTKKFHLHVYCNSVPENRKNITNGCSVAVHIAHESGCPVSNFSRLMGLLNRSMVSGCIQLIAGVLFGVYGA
jgi:hypothetical protein